MDREGLRSLVRERVAEKGGIHGSVDRQRVEFKNSREISEKKNLLVDGKEKN